MLTGEPQAAQSAPARLAPAVVMAFFGTADLNGDQASFEFFGGVPRSILYDNTSNATRRGRFTHRP
jgi:hypothetical protein